MLTIINKMIVSLFLLSLFGLGACSSYDSDANIQKSKPIIKTIERREFIPTLNKKWIGNGISYGAYRDGEGPDKNSLTSKADILEDLKILEKRWNLIRMYGSGQQSRNIIEVIKDNNLPIRVMQGAWISSHQTKKQNDQQVISAIALANDYPEIVVAVNIGNEIFVDWSYHKVKDADQIVRYLRKTRNEIKQPVTVNDDYNFWNKPQSRKIANEVDFIGLHGYAFWNNKTIDEAIIWTKETYQSIKQIYPNIPITFSETGWPTSRIYGEGDEGRLIGKANEINQRRFYTEYNKWINDNKINSLYFEAFNEKWKGGFDGDNPMKKAEKHWGLYYSDRKPKLLLR